MHQITITECTPAHEPGIATLLDGIQAEYAETIYARKPPPVTGERRYWTALHGDAVIGTVGIVRLAGDGAALKSMMLQQEYRGGKYGLAEQLLHIAIQYASATWGTRQVYLGTMVQFRAAQRFYEKHGFTPVEEHMLPAGFPKNPVDTLFFMKAV